MPGTRFSLLLLEPGELYFEDFSVTFSHDAPIKTGGADEEGEPSAAPAQRGRLRLCSKSVFFEPADLKHPILRMNFNSCSSISQKDDILIIECNQVVEMLALNIVSPYTFQKGDFKLHFIFHYATNKECYQRLGQLHRASSLPPREQQAMMEAIVHSRHSRVTFDPCWLEDLHESILFEARAVQPYNSEPFPVLKIRLSEIDRVVRRRYLLQNSALEIYCQQHCTLKHLFLALDSQSLCDELVKKLEQKTSQPSTGLDVATLQWQHGILSNYDYLLFLNSMADRSFNDLTQYPVFPWVVKDFTSPTLNLDDPSIYRDLSRPIGALNPGRLKQLMERYNDMPEPRFLYGSHYMAPGFVLFYLARKFPQLVLCLHGGRFDHPDRMFNSIQQTWQNVMNGAADYKELVPEFYDGPGDFLVNYMGIDFGRRSGDGSPVQDVELPPWAATPKELTHKLRQALESEFVSKSLHRWIDLIFGCLQKGDAAIEAHNLYHPLCYEGSVDLPAIRDPVTRHMYEIQILEFGQIPRQLFPHHPHPPRFAGLIPTPLPLCPRKEEGEEMEETEGRTRSWSQRSMSLSELELSATFQGHKKAVTDVTIILADPEKDPQSPRGLSVSLDGLLKVYRLTDGKQILSVNPIDSSPLTTCLSLPDSNVVVLGTLQNEVALYQLDCCRLDSVGVVHDDCVTSLGFTRAREEEDVVLLASGSADCSIKLWRIRRSDDNQSRTPIRYRFRPPADLLAEMEHDAPVSCLDFSPSGERLVSGTKEGHLQLWQVPSGHPLHVLPGHSNQVSAVKFSPDGTKLVSAGRDGLLQVFQADIDPPQALAKSLDTGEDFRCLVWDGLSVLLGTSRGALLIFDLIEFKIVRRIQESLGPITRIAALSSPALTAVLTAGEDCRVCLWKPAK